MKHQVIVDRCLFLLIAGFLAAAGGCSTSSADGEDATPLRQQCAAAPARLEPRAHQLGTPATPNTSLLREIERRVLPRPIVNGPNRHAELPDYYWDENRSLRDRLEHEKTIYRSGPGVAFHGMTLVAGAAGVGKTFIKGKVFDKDFPKSAVCKFDIRELYDQWAEDGVVADKPDLAADDLVISRLKSVIDKSQPRLLEYLKTQDANFFVIDSLDEIHPDDHAWVLEQVGDFVAHDSRRFIHVAVFGRGFAFREFWKKRKGHFGDADVELYLLKPPTFSTTGDLTVSSWNFHTWKYKLTWAPDGKESSTMPLEAYTRWVESGFARQAEYGSVTCEDNDSMRSDVQDTLMQCASKYPVVCSALYNLAGNSMIREILERDALQRRPYDEHRIEKAYLEAWLTREAKVHSRPSAEQPARFDLYLSLLEAVATKYLAEGAIDDQGCFPVRDGDTILAACGGQKRAFSVKRILDGSGLIVTDPREEGPAKYRFEPLWIHRLMVEMRGERMAKEHRLALGQGAE